MGKVSADATMSLDGYIAGPNESVTADLGSGLKVYPSTTLPIVP